MQAWQQRPRHTGTNYCINVFPKTKHPTQNQWEVILHTLLQYMAKMEGKGGGRWRHRQGEAWRRQASVRAKGKGTVCRRKAGTCHKGLVVGRVQAVGLVMAGRHFHLHGATRQERMQKR